MKTLTIVIGVITLAAPGVLRAQAWQLSGFAGKPVTSVPQNPDDPMYHQSVTEIKVTLSVAD